MPKIGLCNDLICDKEIKQLYECHCCSRLICFNHLTEHVEIEKRNQDRLDSLKNELNAIIIKLKLITEKKLLDIEYEQKLTEKGLKLLSGEISSIDEIDNIFEEINQAITSNYSEESIVKVESSLSNMTNCTCICKCNNKNDQLLLKNMDTTSNFPICLDLTDDTNDVDKSIMTKDNEYSMYVDHELIDDILLEQTTDTIKSEVEDENEQHNKSTSRGITNFIGQCPLTFDGAYGLTVAKHSIHLCATKKIRPINLYSHFISTHRLKSIYVRRLIQAIVNNQHPTTSKIFNENDDVINHFYKIPCPFHKGMINLTGYKTKHIAKVPCPYESVIAQGLKYHLKNYHNTSEALARRLIMRTKHNIMSS